MCCYASIPREDFLYFELQLIDSSYLIFTLERVEFRGEMGESIASLYPFKKEEIHKDLDWVFCHWLDEREAVPASNPAKCWACDCANICDSSLMK